eukprot:7176653-Pyramimonas_sp.AAC.1
MQLFPCIPQGDSQRCSGRLGPAAPNKYLSQRGPLEVSANHFLWLARRPEPILDGAEPGDGPWIFGGAS